MNVVSCCAFYMSLMALIMVKILEVIVFSLFNWVGVSGDLFSLLYALPMAGRGVVPAVFNTAAS